MKAFTFLFVFLFSLPAVVCPQTTASALSKVTVALHEKQWEQAVVLFRQAIRSDVDKAEMFYWTDVDKSSEVSGSMAHELASFYKDSRNYDKAFLFYKELTQAFPKNASYLASCAEVEVFRGKEKNALSMYEQVLELDVDNLAANIFIGNYYFLTAEQDKAKLEADFKKISSPTRMQHARFKNELAHVFTNNYSKARVCLENVVRQFSSVEARRTLERIQRIEKEINK